MGDSTGHTGENPPITAYERGNRGTDDWFLFDGADGYASFNDTDTPAEVFAVWRTQRRLAISYMAVFLVGTLGVALAINTLPWVTDTTVFDGFSPGFMLAAFGLYGFFLVIGVAAASLANAVEDRMMGATAVEPGPTQQ